MGLLMSEPEVDEWGARRWRFNGVLHRTLGPAIEWANGDRSWWTNGVRHRTLGPAIEFADGTGRWYLNGESYSFEDWCRAVNITPEERMILKITYGITDG